MAHSIAKWAAACKVRGTIPISSILVHLLEERVEGDVPLFVGLLPPFRFLCKWFLNNNKKKKRR